MKILVHLVEPFLIFWWSFIIQPSLKLIIYIFQSQNWLTCRRTTPFLILSKPIFQKSSHKILVIWIAYPFFHQLLWCSEMLIYACLYLCNTAQNMLQNYILINPFVDIYVHFVEGLPEKTMSKMKERKWLASLSHLSWKSTK